MFRFGKASMRHILTLDEELQVVLLEAIKTSPLDFSVISGHRGEKEQNSYFIKGTGLKWPDSKHNKMPSQAFDFAPFYRNNPHIRWDNVDDFVTVAKHILATGAEMCIYLRSGSDWDQDGKYREDGEYDGPHIEMVT